MQLDFFDLLKPTARPDRHSSHPYHGCDEMNEALEVDDPAFVSGCEATKVLHSAEGALDAVAVFVGSFVMLNDGLARSV